MNTPQPKSSDVLPALPDLSEKDIMLCITAAACFGNIKMTFESGPYDITRPSMNADKLAHTIVAARDRQWREAVALALAAQKAAPAGEARPDILEKLTYHALERDDLTLDECLDFLANGWRKTRGRIDRQMVMQILSLLAAAPSTPPSEAEQAEAPLVNDPNCKYCGGTGRCIVGNSGREDDGNAAEFADCECWLPATPPPAIGAWTLTAPDGRMWFGTSPIRCVAEEQRERIPAAVALARIYAAADEPESTLPPASRDEPVAPVVQEGLAEPTAESDAPLWAHIRALHDALNGLIDFIEIDGLKMDPLALSIARNAVKCHPPQSATQPPQQPEASGAGERSDFEIELRKQCFQMPTPEAFELAWSMWKARAALTSKPPAVEQKRCGYCDDTGDVHSIDGEWRGRCTCPAGQPEQVAQARDAAARLKGSTLNMDRLAADILSQCAAALESPEGVHFATDPCRHGVYRRPCEQCDHQPTPPTAPAQASEGAAAPKSFRCPASRHTMMIAEYLLKGQVISQVSEEPEHCGESLVATVNALWGCRRLAALRASSPSPLPQGITRDDTVHGEIYYTEAQMRSALGIVTKESTNG